MKVAEKAPSLQELKEELKEIKAWKSKAPKDHRLEDIARQFAAEKQWDLAMAAFELVSKERERNLLIADLIEGHLLPAHEIALAKRFARYLTPVVEMESLVWLKIALADHDTEQALKIAERLPSPLSRNYAYMHIMESFLQHKEKSKIDSLHQLMIDNIKTIYDSKTRSYILRELALNLFLPNKAREQALEMAMMIPDEAIRNQVMNKIGG